MTNKQMQNRDAHKYTAKMFTYNNKNWQPNIE